MKKEFKKIYQFIYSFLFFFSNGLIAQIYCYSTLTISNYFFILFFSYSFNFSFFFYIFTFILIFIYYFIYYILLIYIDELIFFFSFQLLEFLLVQYTVKFGLYIQCKYSNKLTVHSFMLDRYVVYLLRGIFLY